MNILADAALPGLSEAFPSPFKLTLYTHNEEIPEHLKDQDVLLCRSTLKVNQALLASSSIRYVATASSGSDHFDYDFLQLKNIVPIDAKGCNAVAVADYVVSSLAYLDKVALIGGSKAGIVGLGHVGTKVSARLVDAGFEPVSYDPLRANKEHSFVSCSKESLYDCDVLCIHAELHNNEPYPSRNLIDANFLKQLKPGCVIINASRGGIVDEQALLNHPDIIYCTDVYLNEPQINKEIIARATLSTPHIAGHSLEAKFAAVAIVSKKLHNLLGLPSPAYATPAAPELILDADYNSWQELALKLYNPLAETLQLKQAANLEEAFLLLRKKHNYRHDFCAYLI